MDRSVATRLVRAIVVDIRTQITGVGIPRTVVDCLGIMNREPINAATTLGSSGMQWLASRPPLKPTSRNVKSGRQFSINSVDRMAEMLYDLDPEGWDGDEVMVAFYGREAVVLGNVQHRWENFDLEDGIIEDTLEPGRRLQDEPEWDKSNTDESRDILVTARNNSHPDAMNFRWGNLLATFWETRGFVAEFARNNAESGTLRETYSAGLEWSPEWFWTQNQRIRLDCFDEPPDDGGFLTTRHFVYMCDGTESGIPLPEPEDTIDGIHGVVTNPDTDDYREAFAATVTSGGDQVGDKLASATRYPEFKEVFDAQQKQIDELRGQIETIRDYLLTYWAAINLIQIPSTPPVPIGTTAISAAGLTDAPVSIPGELTPLQPSPSQQTLDDARSEVFRVGV
jgi:hypothetical protein